MANILHRLSIDAPPERVRDLIAAKEGIEQWWTAPPLSGSDTRGGEFRSTSATPTESPRRSRS